MEQTWFRSHYWSSRDKVGLEPCRVPVNEETRIDGGTDFKMTPGSVWFLSLSFFSFSITRFFSFCYLENMKRTGHVSFRKVTDLKRQKMERKVKGGFHGLVFLFL